MRLDLAERLRCPNDHAPTPLITVASEKRGTDLVRGFAGCPVCRFEARVDAGDLHLGAAQERAGATVGTPVGATAGGSADAWQPELERTVALLGLAEPGGAILLGGRYAALAGAIEVTCDVAVIVIAPAVPVASAEGVATVHGAVSRIPFNDATFRAAALDADTPAALADDAVRTIAIGGRLLAAATLASPAGLRELARDAQEWVAEREATSGIVALRRG